MTVTRLPLLNDRHTHVSFYAALGAAADLSACVTRAQALAALKRGRRSGGLLLARGWKNNHYDLPRAELDRLGAVVVCNVSLHSFAFSSGAVRLLAPRLPGLAAGIEDQEWVERHLNAVFGLFAAAAGPRAITAYMAALARQGVWAAADMLVADDAAARTLAGRFAGRCELWSEPELFSGLGRGARAAVTGLKIFTDGALGARTAALKRPYRGGGRGLLLHTDAGLRRVIGAAARLKGRLAVHAIGDAAIDQALAALEDLALPASALRARLENAQLITAGQARRAKRLGVQLCMQPNFSSDSVCYADRLPARYLRANNPFRMLIDEAGFAPGEDLVFGSDGMPHGAAAALEGALFPPYPGQRLTLAEFRAGYCLPGFGPGRLDVRVDEKGRKVGVKVRLAGAAV